MQHFAKNIWRLVFGGILLIMLSSAGARAAPGPAPAGDMVKDMLAGPMKDVTEVVFAARQVFGEHWYANIGYYAPEPSAPTYRKGGRLCKLNLRTGKLALLVDDPEGGVRDPCVHYDGQRILFSYRKGGTPCYHLYVINADGTGLQQLTAGEYDDYEPVWLPDGGIAFVTTRAKRWVNCWLTQVGNIWRCDGDGRNMRALSANLEQDNTPWVLPDGRLLYMRWEYVDRSQVHYHHLWTMNPDGTGQTVFFGNFHPGDVYLDAKPIPGSDRIVLSRSPGHGGMEHEGWLATLDVKNGPDDLNSMHTLTHDANCRDPWAFNNESFMLASHNRLEVADAQGRRATLYTLPKEFGDAWLHEPRPLLAHAPEAVIPPRTDLAQATGRYLLNDAYLGRNMAGVKPGEIKKLMVVESLPKPINYTGGMDPLSYGGTFTLERVLGTVPVESDGSAYFEVPALRAVFFIALDEHGRAVKRMQSFTSVEPGETLSCLGCHEERTSARAATQTHVALAASHPPSKLEPFAGVPDLPDFARDIQPILNHNCLPCHDVDKRAGGVLLTGDHGPMFSHSYYSLTVWNQLSDGRNQPRSNYPPHVLGTGSARLLAKIDGTHYGAKVTEREALLIRLWLDIGAPYPGTYAALGTGMIGGYISNAEILCNDKDWPETRAAQEVYAQRCNCCHTQGVGPIPHSLADETEVSFWQPHLNDPRLRHSRHIVFNLSRPDKSLMLLAPLARSAGGYGMCKAAGTPATADSTVFIKTDDPGYQKLLAMCVAGQHKLDEIKRFDMPGFKPRPEYIREMKRYGVLPATFDLAKDPLDVYELDRRYWASLWHTPGGVNPWNVDVPPHGNVR